MIRFALGLALLAPPATAQTWETFAAGTRLGAGICPRAMSHADDGTYCLSVLCDGGEGPFLDLSFLGFGGLPETAAIRVDAGGTAIDGTVEAVIDDRVTVYRLDLTQAASNALRRGQSATATIAEAEGPPLLDLSFPLSGSGAGIERVDALCATVREKAQTSGSPPEGIYSTQAVESELVGRDLRWSDTAIRLAADGAVSDTDTDTDTNAARTGQWHFEGSDRVCLTLPGADPDAGTQCLQFYRSDGTLMVRRNDDSSQDVLGEVEIAE